MDHSGQLQAGGRESGAPWTPAVCSLTDAEVVFLVNSVEVARYARSDVAFVLQGDMYRIDGAEEPIFFYPDDREGFQLATTPLTAGERIAQARSQIPSPGPISTSVGSTGKPFWKRWWFIVAGVVLFIAAIAGGGEDEPDERGVATTTPSASSTATTKKPETTTTNARTTTITVASSTSTPETATTVGIPGSLGMTPDQFRENWNAFLRESDVDGLDLPPISVESGAIQDVFSVELSDEIFILGSVNKNDGSLRDVTILSSPSEDPLTNANMLLTWAALIAATDPSLPPDQTGQVLRDLGIIDGDAWTEDGYVAQTTPASVRFSFSSYVETLGAFQFSAGDPLDN